MLEWDEAGNADRARQLFQAGASVAPSYQHPPLYQAWAEREAAVGEHERAQQLTRDAYEVAKAAQQRVKGPQSAQSA
jgi:pre-mRNA-processing factor 6